MVKKIEPPKQKYSIFAFPKETAALEILRKKFPTNPEKALTALAVNFPDTWQEAWANRMSCVLIARVERILKSLSEEDKAKAKGLITYFGGDK